MKRINVKAIYTVVASVAVLIAAAVATSACSFFVYQPEEPKSLRED